MFLLCLTLIYVIVVELQQISHIHLKRAFVQYLLLSTVEHVLHFKRTWN